MISTVSAVTSNVSSLSLSPTQSTQGWKKEECTPSALQDLVTQKFTQLIKDLEKRDEESKTSLAAAAKGPWYANQNYLALKHYSSTNQTAQARLDTFKARNSFYDGFPPQGFNRIKDPSHLTGNRICGYVLNPEKNISASKGMQNMKETFSFIDCQEAIEIALYDSLHEVLGEKKFDELFDAKGKTPLQLDCSIKDTPLQNFISVRQFSPTTPLGKSPVKKGEAVHFKNLPFYGFKHPQGEGSGFHALCIQDTPEVKFTAFGVPFEGVTEEGMLDILVDAFNEKPLEQGCLTTEELDKKVIAVHQKDYPMLAKTLNLSLQAFKKEYLPNRQTSRKELLDTKADYPTLVGLHPSAYKLDAAKVKQHLK